MLFRFMFTVVAVFTSAGFADAIHADDRSSTQARQSFVVHVPHRLELSAITDGSDTIVELASTAALMIQLDVPDDDPSQADPQQPTVWMTHVAHTTSSRIRFPTPRGHAVELPLLTIVPLD